MRCVPRASRAESGRQRRHGYKLLPCDLRGRSSPRPHIEALRIRALTYRHQLPDFVAQQTTTAREGFSTNIITAQVTFRQGQEHYSHVTINGRPVPSSSITRTPPRISSSARPASLDRCWWIYSPRPLQSNSSSARRLVCEVSPSQFTNFTSLREKHILDFAWYQWTNPETGVSRPAMVGAAETGRPLREELEPVNLPSSSGVVSIRTVSDYAMTSVGGVGAFLLPVKSESTICIRVSDVPCTTNVLVFHDYRKFAATTRILDVSSEP